MKKTLCMILAFLLVMCSMSVVITSYAEDDVNLLADATNANGSVTWDSNIDVRPKTVDSTTESVYGGHTWTFGIGGLNHQAEDFAHVYIKASGLVEGKNYEFSYVYQKDYKFAIDSVKTANGTTVSFENSSTSNVAEKARAYKVTTVFTAPANGDYTITLKTGKCASMRTSDCAWDVVILSDLSLTVAQVEQNVNILKDASKANGDVTWTTVTDVDNRVGNLEAWGGSYQDNKTNSVNGGYSWLFGLGDGKVGGDTVYTESKYLETYGYIYIKAHGLKANTRYDFSYIYQEDYVIYLESVTASDNSKVELEIPPVTTVCTAKARSYQVSTIFEAPKDGDYTITLKTNRANRTSDCKYSKVILSDLVLMKTTAAKKVTAEVVVSGNGDATVSNEGPEIGSEVTFNAIPYPDEEFLGWYNGDTKVSDKAEFKVVVNEAISLIAKFTSKSLNVLAGKKASDWTGYQWARLTDSAETKNGGKGYLIDDAMWQSIYIKVTLKANTEYKFSFNWKSVFNSAGPTFPGQVKVYSANAANIEDRATNWQDGDYKPTTGTDLEQGGGYANADIAATYEWQHLATTFKTAADTDYNLVILFDISGVANKQAINVSDFVLEEVTKEVPSISNKDASDWSCFEWSSIENSDVSRYGGKGYLVKKAMWQNIFTSVTLKPNTKYSFSFEWKAVDSPAGPVFPDKVFVVAKDDIDMWDTSNKNIWNPDNGFTAGSYDLETGGVINNGELAATYEWQNTTVSFTTKDATDYGLLIHFQASGNGNQEIYISDLKIEEVGEVGPGDDDDDDVVEGENLAANYSNANGRVTWTDNAGPHFRDERSDLEGGFSWGFGMPDSHLEEGDGKDPVYITIKTDKLTAGNKYEFSFIYQKDFIIDLDSIDSDAEIYDGPTSVKLLEGDNAYRVTVRFTAKKDSEHIIKLITGKFKKSQTAAWSHVVLCDLKLVDVTNRVYGSIKSEIGGTATGYDSEYCVKGDEITLTATPRSGNNFEGWFDEEGNKVSGDLVYKFTAEKDFNLLAKFSGSNVPNSEWLTEHGMDGTFENGDMLGWKAEDRDNWDDTSWAAFERSSDMSYNGDYSLRMRARWRTSFYKFTDLKKRTNYRLSFYVNHPDMLDFTVDEETGNYLNGEALIQWFGITSHGVSLYSEAGSSSAPAVKGGTGWHKVSMCFTTGDYTDADFEFYYTNRNPRENEVDYKEFIYMDDISLVEYTSNTFTNGDFEDGAAPWRGEFTAENGVGKGTNLYQNVNVGAQTLNTVTFKAKGKGLGGASEIIAKEFNVDNYVSSQSVVEINSDDWKTYTFTFYSGVNTDVSLFFKAQTGELLVDDVTVTKAEDRGGAVVEKIDFESDRFALHTASDVFEIYSGSEGDANVHSGTKSLRFNSANAVKDVLYLFQDAFVSAQIPAKLNYKLTLYYKTTKGNTIYLSPEYLPDDTIQAEYTAAGNGWTKVEFIFSKMIDSHIKVAIGNVIGKTNADFYIDDITLTLTPPMVLETDSENKYCEWPLNVLNNEGFEDKFTKNDWADLPKTTELRTDKGFAGDNYLRINAKTYYVMPVKIEASETYYFSISTRLGKNSSGYVAVATDPAGAKLYTDMDGNVASKMVVDTAKWSRDAILFSTNETGVIYLVFAADKGYIDIDEIALYKRQYGKDVDPNDHTKYVPYNYDNPDPSTVVLNGGDPTFSGKEQFLGESPETGDTRTAPATILVITTFAAMVLLLTAKRTRKIFKGGKA